MRVLLPLLIILAGCSSGVFVTTEVVDLYEERHEFDSSDIVKGLTLERCQGLLESRSREDAHILCAMGRERWCQP